MALIHNPMLEKLQKISEYAHAKGGTHDRGSVELRLSPDGIRIIAYHPTAPRGTRAYNHLISWGDLDSMVDEGVVPIVQSKIDNCWHRVREVHLDTH